MTDTAIRVENLGKLYRIGPRERYKALRDTLTDALYAPFRRLRSAFQSPSLKASQPPNGNDTVWALKDVSFEIKHGQVVGIIGPNGAGKSTLLKILSRITEPTEGSVEIHGRVGSLLEVGTSFHPELTGRENIYLNGAVLGMRKAEIARKFDAIVDFAGVERFIDTPVKHYSSGMAMRLGFAVAAHLEPEILVVDEVLAVGDAEFQRKCLGKMEEVSVGGRTVLFVSHNMAVIGRLCGTSMLLDDGRIAKLGPTAEVVASYLSRAYAPGAVCDFPLNTEKIMQIRQVRVVGHLGQPATDLDIAHPFRVQIEINVHQEHVPVCLLVCWLETLQGTAVCESFSSDSLKEEIPLAVGNKCVVEVEFPGGLFNAGEYTINISLGGLQHLEWDRRTAMIIRLQDRGSFAAANAVGSKRGGVMLLRLPWRVLSQTIS